MGCLYCLDYAKTLACTGNCLASSNISTSYIDIASGGIFLSFIFVILAFVFKDNLKRSLGLKLLGIASMVTGITTFGLIFNGHWLLKSIPYIIPSIGAASYAASYFLSFYLVKASYKSMPIKNYSLINYAHKASKMLKVKRPDLYTFGSEEPQAFLLGGHKKSIFLSSTLVKRLDFKALKAVILHELYHLKRNSATLKNIVNSFGNTSFRLLPVPIKELERIEEKEIDNILLKVHNINMNNIREKIK